jgi:hypothetical protein
METEDLTLDVEIHRFDEAYWIELGHHDPSNRVEIAAQRGQAQFDLDALRAVMADSKEYGKTLAKQLFH